MQNTTSYMPVAHCGTAAAVRRRLTVGIGALVVSALLLGSYAPAEAVPRAVRRACKGDYKRICPHYRSGTAKMRSCMRANVGQISPRCYNTLLRYGYGGSRGKRRRRR